MTPRNHRPAALLTEAGYRVRAPANAPAALYQIEREVLDLLLLDLILPGMDGFALLTILRERSLLPPLLTMTESSLAFERARRDLGLKHCLMKPLDEARLLARLPWLLDSDTPPVSLPFAPSHKKSEARLPRPGGNLASCYATVCSPP